MSEKELQKSLDCGDSDSLLSFVADFVKKVLTNE